MLILDDSTPICGHDPQTVARQLAGVAEAFRCSCALLDFQRPSDEADAIIRAVQQALPCRVGVSSLHANGRTCPVLLPPVPEDVPLGSYLAPWKGREIWLEAALGGMQITLTACGALRQILPRAEPAPRSHVHTGLHCHYHAALFPGSARFTLWRTREDLHALLDEAAQLGVAMAVGLYQELSAQPGSKA